MKYYAKIPSFRDNYDEQYYHDILSLYRFQAKHRIKNVKEIWLDRQTVEESINPELPQLSFLCDEKNIASEIEILKHMGIILELCNKDGK